VARETVREYPAKDWRPAVTDIVSDEQRSSPLFCLLTFPGLGLIAGKLAARYWWQVLISFRLGVLGGHFWW